jgi:hypothetical protein
MRRRTGEGEVLPDASELAGGDTDFRSVQKGELFHYVRAFV